MIGIAGVNDELECASVAQPHGREVGRLARADPAGNAALSYLGRLEVSRIGVRAELTETA